MLYLLFTSIVRLLHELTRKGAEFVWTPEYMSHCIQELEKETGSGTSVVMPLLQYYLHTRSRLMLAWRKLVWCCRSLRKMAICTQLHLLAELSHCRSRTMPSPSWRWYGQNYTFTCTSMDRVHRPPTTRVVQRRQDMSMYSRVSYQKGVLHY